MCIINAILIYADDQQGIPYTLSSVFRPQFRDCKDYERVVTLSSRPSGVGAAKLYSLEIISTGLKQISVLEGST